MTVCTIAAYGSPLILTSLLLLLPILLKQDTRTFQIIFIVIWTCITYFFLLTKVPAIQTSGEAEVTFRWTENVQIDGRIIKGFVETSTGDILYMNYRFADEAEKERAENLHISSTVWSVSGVFREEMIPAHPYSFQMNRYLQMYGASGVFDVEEIFSMSEESTLLSKISFQRARITAQIEEKFPQSLQTEAKALLIGDRSDMDDEEAKLYRTLGITHLFAISGLHVGLLTLIVRELLLRVSVRRETVDILLIISLPLYAVIAGGAPSVWRAVSVTVFLLILRATPFRFRVDDVLAISAIVFILIKPYVLFQVGFQLSYGAAFALVYSSAILQRVHSPVYLSFHITLISQLALYPILLFHFFELSLSSFFVNIFYVPLYAFLILPTNVFLLFLSFFHEGFAQVIFMFYEPVRHWISVITEALATIPFQLWNPGKPTIFLVLIAYSGVLVFFIAYEITGRLGKPFLFVLIPALCIHFVPYLDGELRVTFLDVGQGDGAVIELPYKKAVYLVDTGGTVSFGEPNWQTPQKSFEVGRKIVVPYLKGRGITKIDKLILSHAHLDHMEGADEVMEEVKVDEIHISPGSDAAEEMEDVLRIAFEKKIAIQQLRDGANWQHDHIQFSYLAPQDDRYVGNDSSLALLMQTPAGLNFLFTGDMEEEAERKFVQKYYAVDFGNLILKVGHHGSRTSSTEPFIELIDPQLAIVSAGRNNRYGHPHKEVMETFEKYNVPTLVTAEEGSVMITIKDNQYYVTTMKK